jgi:protocatechuate 3,4-dioxygenase beta subunit
MQRTLLPALCFVIATPVFAQQTFTTVQAPGTPTPTPAPARDNQPKTGTARIRGHVYAAENGAPLRRAQVRLFAPELRDQRVTATDERGAYEFKDLPAGRFNVSASKGSFVSLQFGQTRPMQGGTPLQVLDGQTIEKVDFALPRGSIITGRVVDEFGEPVADVQVMPMQSRFMQGRRRLTPVGRNGQTNDIGEYRIFGLSPGDYYVSATMRNFSSGDSDDHSGYAPTYYPGTANGSEAQKVSLSVGQSVSEINITLVATRTARITGTVIDSQGRPVAQGFVNAMPRNSGGMFFGPTGGGQVRDGTFTLSGIAPGDYTLRANIGNGVGADGRPEFATATVSVNGEDINGVRLTAATLVTLTGRIVVQDTGAAQSLKPPIRINLSPVNPDDQMFMPGGNTTAKDDFTFELKSQPGQFRVFAGASGGAQAMWVVHAVRQNGVDVTDTGIEISSSGETSGIEIEFTNHVSELSGIVTNQRGEVAKDYTLIVFSQDREQWTGNTRYRSQGRPDQDGRFKIRALPAGRYYAVALENADPGDSGDPDFFDRIRMKATMFSLNDGETKTLDLKIQTGG